MEVVSTRGSICTRKRWGGGGQRQVEKSQRGEKVLMADGDDISHTQMDIQLPGRGFSSLPPCADGGWRMADVRAYAATPLRQGSFSLVLFIVAAWGGGQLASIV